MTRPAENTDNAYPATGPCTCSAIAIAGTSAMHLPGLMYLDGVGESIAENIDEAPQYPTVGKIRS